MKNLAVILMLLGVFWFTIATFVGCGGSSTQTVGPAGNQSNPAGGAPVNASAGGSMDEEGDEEEMEEEEMEEEEMEEEEEEEEEEEMEEEEMEEEEEEEMDEEEEEEDF